MKINEVVKEPSNEEYEEMAQKIDSEGFGYYMLSYGPDLDFIERAGFNRKEVKKAIELFEEIEQKIYMDYI